MSSFRRLIRTINQNTINPTDNPPHANFFREIFKADRSCVIRKLKIHLIWSNNMEINIDNRDPENPTTWNLGNKLAFLVYLSPIENKHVVSPPSDNRIFPKTNNNDLYYNNEPVDTLLSYGFLRIDRSAGNPIDSTTTTEGEITFEGSIETLISAPDGIGSSEGAIVLGPGLSEVNVALISTTTPLPQFGGTTVSVFKEKENFHIVLKEGDYIYFSGVYDIIANVNTGQNLFGTIDLLLEY